MIYDVNTYIGHWPFRQLRNNTAEGLVKKMDEAGISVACVSSVHSIFYKDTQEGNMELVKEIAPYQNRFLPFAIINPTYPAWKNDFLTGIQKMNMKGLELYPYYHQYNLTCPESVELVRLAGELGLPVHLPCAVVNMRQRHWMDTQENLDYGQVERLLSLCPDTDVIITNGPSDIIAQKLQKVTRERKGKVFYDFARVEVYPIRGAKTNFQGLVAAAGVDRIVFGSCMPFQYLEPQLIRLNEMGFEKDDLEKILFKNMTYIIDKESANVL
ncbi:MAG TPA: hypothetical protein DDZ89_14125 [Clostridiales bacterium]|nr:hypothetical protein [Clostridiales bacterium]